MTAGKRSSEPLEADAKQRTERCCHCNYWLKGDRSSLSAASHLGNGHNQLMRIRGLFIVLALLVVILNVVPGSRRANDQATTTAPPVAAQQPQPAAIEATLPSNGAIRAQPGQSVNLLIRSDSPDVAQIEQLGLTVAVGPGIPGALTVIAPSDGRYPVTLQLTKRTIGVIDVGS